jgi:uncharacterized RDD family membrane protein YckC
VTTLVPPATGAGTPTAGVVTRALAFSLDALLLVTGIGGLLVLVAVLGAVLGWEPFTLVQRLAAVFITTLPLLWLGLNAAMWTMLGRTPGKALFGLRVVRADGTPVGLGRSVVRALGYLISAILLLGFLWVLVDPDRRAWHDRLAGTAVVYDRRPGNRRPMWTPRTPMPA